ncbi:MAG: hypothetical protein SPJ84_06540 [Fusobacterium gastrosuis]|uniref:hypothetical protein n=1 Tax=Fusobacterium gastrosuis TaxID=1755100 RepID=UPI002A9BEF6B|nr:hypothetical protein [Fusobacterium gastrosuis]
MIEVFETDYESPYEYTHFGQGYGKRFNHPLYDEYCDKIDRTLIIMEPNNIETEKDIIETLEKSLKNGSDFYTNAKDYMKKIMEDYVEMLNNETLF